MAMHPLSTENWMEMTNTMHATCQTATGDMHFPSRLDNFHQCTKAADFINQLQNLPEHRLLAQILCPRPPKHTPCLQPRSNFKKIDLRLSYPCQYQVVPLQKTMLMHAPTHSVSFPLPTVDFGSNCLRVCSFLWDLIKGTDGTETFSWEAQCSFIKHNRQRA